MNPHREAVADAQLERQGRRIGRPAGRFLVVALLVAIPGVVLVVIDHGWTLGVGVAILLLASIPGAIGLALLVSGAVTRWSARHKSFA